jgi:hypothetical protein
VTEATKRALHDLARMSRFRTSSRKRSISNEIMRIRMEEAGGASANNAGANRYNLSLHRTGSNGADDDSES